MNKLVRWDRVSGSVVRVYSRPHGVWHYGVLGSPTATGWTVFHASKDRGYFACTSFDEFADGLEVAGVWAPLTSEQQEAILHRASSIVGHPFRLRDSNCEDTVNWIIAGQARSPQRERIAVAAGIVLLFGFGGFFS
jgi:hypothetical protein